VQTAEENRARGLALPRHGHRLPEAKARRSARPPLAVDFPRAGPTFAPNATLWTRLAPEIDRALERLHTRQRDAVLLCAFLNHDSASALGFRGNKLYVIRYSDDFYTWNALGSPILGTEEMLGVSDPTPVANIPRRWYRVFVE